MVFKICIKKNVMIFLGSLVFLFIVNLAYAADLTNIDKDQYTEYQDLPENIKSFYRYDIDVISKSIKKNNDHIIRQNNSTSLMDVSLVGGISYVNTSIGKIDVSKPCFGLGLNLTGFVDNLWLRVPLDTSISFDKNYTQMSTGIMIGWNFFKDRYNLSISDYWYKLDNKKFLSDKDSAFSSYNEVPLYFKSINTTATLLVPFINYTYVSENASSNDDFDNNSIDDSANSQSHLFGLGLFFNKFKTFGVSWSSLSHAGVEYYISRMDSSFDNDQTSGTCFYFNSRIIIELFYVEVQVSDKKSYIKSGFDFPIMLF
jgi:hypothetical protein